MSIEPNVYHYVRLSKGTTVVFTSYYLLQNASVVFRILLLWSWCVQLSAQSYFPTRLSLGFGHATRVSAFARHILSLDESHRVNIVSSAPKHVFATSIALGAIYRNAEIDPVILQPLAFVTLHRT